MDVRRTLLHGSPHQTIDELDNGRLARHVLQALDVVGTDEDLFASPLSRRARLARLFGRLVESLQREREILLRDEAGSDRLVDEVGDRGERLGVEGVCRRNNQSIRGEFDRQQAIAPHEVRREQVLEIPERGQGRQVGLAENGIAEVIGNRGHILRRGHKAELGDDYIDALPGLELNLGRTFNRSRVEQPAFAQELEEPACRGRIARIRRRRVDA